MDIKPRQNKKVVDNRLPAPSRNDPLDYNSLPCCGVALPVVGATPRHSAKKMKIALASICSVLCFGFALLWIALTLYAKGMGGFSGNYPWILFSKFWVGVPIFFAIIGAAASWLSLSTVTKITLLGSLIVICFGSLLIDDVAVFGKSSLQSKMLTILLGSIPIFILLCTWTAGLLLSKKHEPSLTRSDGEQ